MPGGRAAQTASLQGTPTDLLLTANGRRVLALDRGQGRDAGDDGFRAKTRAAVTTLDGPTLAVWGRVELGWFLATPDGRTAVVLSAREEARRGHRRGHGGARRRSRQAGARAFMTSPLTTAR